MKTQIKFSPSVIIEAQNLLAIAMTNQKHDLFFEFLGHVNGVTMSVHRGGWSEGVPAEYSVRLFCHDENEFEQALLKSACEIRILIAGWDAAPEQETFSAKAKAMRDAAAKLLADADALTAPKQEVAS